MNTKLYEIAHSRAGDKGNTLILSLIPFEAKHYELLRTAITADKVKQHFKDMIHGEVLRYELPNLSAFQFVCYHALSGGVTTSLVMDTHGKTMSYALLEMEVEINTG